MFDFKLSDTEYLRIDHKTYKGKHYLDVRVFYDVDEKGDEGKPGKGLTVHYSRAVPLLKRLNKWISEEGLELARELEEAGAEDNERDEDDDDDDTPKKKKKKAKR